MATLEDGAKGRARVGGSAHTMVVALRETMGSEVVAVVAVVVVVMIADDVVAAASDEIASLPPPPPPTPPATTTIRSHRGVETALMLA